MQKLHYAFHSIAYYAAWLICLHLAAQGHAWWASTAVLFSVTLQIIWQRIIMQQTSGLLSLVILLTCVGTVIDTLYMRWGFITFQANPFLPSMSPPWMIMIWISFAVFLYATFKKYFHYYRTLAFLSLPGFAFAYFCGSKMGAAHFSDGNRTPLLIGLTWSFLLPLCLLIYNQFYQRRLPPR